MARSKGAAAAVVLVVMMALVQSSMATNFLVGGPLGWQVNRYNDPNFYQDWERSNFPIRTSDSLVFQWSQGDSVMLVNEADFNTCNILHPIAFWMNELHLVFPLTERKNQRLFFISGANNHCGSGQKFFIDVYPTA